MFFFFFFCKPLMVPRVLHVNSILNVKFKEKETIVFGRLNYVLINIRFGGERHSSSVINSLGVLG